MKKKIFISILISLSLMSFSYSQGKFRDPFEPLLPSEVDAEKEGEKERAREDEKERQERIVSEAGKILFSIVIQGILWGGDLPQVIIDGEVYKPGDRLKNIDAQIFKIEKGAVFISYGEKIYRIKIGKKEEI